MTPPCTTALQADHCFGRRRIGRFLTICALASAAVFPMNAANLTSAELWQSYVKNPNAHPNIPNCSFAGYRRGEVPLPSPRVVANVRQTGAKGDGTTDDTAAFEVAIKKAAASKGGAVLIPAGTYLLNGMIRLNESGVVLRGEGEDRTTLLFQKPLDEVVGARRSGSSSAWSWYGGLIWMGPLSGMPGEPWSEATEELWSAGPVLAEVTAPAKRGDFTVQVNSTAGLKPGATVLMTWQNPPDHSLLIAMAGHELMRNYDWKGSAGGLIERPKWIWPVEIAAVAGNQVTLRQPLRIDALPEWKVAFETMGPHVAECGVENLTIKMADHPASKHLADKGFNGIYLNRALNCWVRNVKIENSDNGLIHASAKNTTVTGLKITGGPHHHATAQRVMSHDNLIEDFTIESKPRHGINTEALSTGTVWRSGKMAHGTFDSHRQMSWDLIRTNITINNDGSPGGGNQAGPLLGARVVHWNIRVTGKDEFVYQPDCHSMGALVGIQGVAPSAKSSWAMVPGDKGCIVADDGKVPTPPDLYEAQLKLRLGTR